MFLADETVFQQQVRELWSIEGSLSFIGTILTVMAIIGCIATVIAGARMARANRIARASHDLLKVLVDEQKKANEFLEKIVARTGRIAPQVEKSDVQKIVQANETDTPSVYKL